MNSEELLICNVNDSAASRYVLTRMLTQAGFRVVEVINGEDAVALAARDRPHLMLLDLELPDIDGMEVCRRLKADPQTASIAILQTSAAFATTEAKVHGLDGGADGFLIEPFTAQELVATVRSLLRLKGREIAQLRRADALAEADRLKDVSRVMHGTIALHRETEMELRLPASAPRRDIVVAEPEDPGEGARSVRVLIVEDNSDAREILAELCSIWKHEVLVAEDGLKAVEMALAHRPDVAFIDIGLPGIDGYEVARRLRADPRGAAIKLIALSGYGAPGHREASAAAGFAVHLIKPADAEQVAALIAASGPVQAAE